MSEGRSAPAAANEVSGGQRLAAITDAEGLTILAMLPAGILLTWGVPCVLALLEGEGRNAAAGTVLADVALYARFLVALPILVLAILKLDARLEECRAQFLTAKIIGPEMLPAFDGVTDRFAALRAPLAAFVACLVLAYASAVAYAFVFGTHLAPVVGPNWHMSADGQGLSLAGWWHLLVSQPAYAFVLFWLAFRVGVVWWLFWRIAGLDLRLNALHGDEAAGLGFLRNLLRPLSLAAFAVSASAAGSLADLLLYADAAIADYAASIGIFALMVSIVLAGPMVLFSPAIRRARRQAVLQYGATLRQRADDFRTRSASGAPGRDAVTEAEFLSFSNAIFATVQRTRPLILRVEVLKVATAALVPFAVVATLQLPADTIVQQLKLFIR